MASLQLRRCFIYLGLIYFLLNAIAANDTCDSGLGVALCLRILLFLFLSSAAVPLLFLFGFLFIVSGLLQHMNTEKKNDLRQTVQISSDGK